LRQGSFTRNPARGRTYGAGFGGTAARRRFHGVRRCAAPYTAPCSAGSGVKEP